MRKSGSKPGTSTAHTPSNEKFEELQEAWKHQQKLNLQRRSAVGAKAVIVPEMDQLPGEAAGSEFTEGPIGVAGCITYEVAPLRIPTAASAS